MDDANTMFHFVAWGHSGGVEQEAWRKFNAAQVGIDLDASFRPIRTRENNYLQDRGLMKLGDFTGIKGIPNQDIAMWESMGAIADRSKERLGASDLAVAKFRRLMVNAAKTMRDGGSAIGMSKPRIPHSKLAAFEGVVPKTIPWQTLGVSQEEMALARSHERLESAESVG
jgi:phthalate 4,5-dioxygenase oxygenase subunit